MSTKPVDPDSFLGRSPESLTLAERLALAGQWIALEIYTPKRLPLRKIEAIGESQQSCLRQLEARGLEPARYELQLLHQPY